MRSAVALALVVVSGALAISGDVAAETPRPRRRAPSAVSTATPARGFVALQTPGPDRVLVRGGTFTMGASDVEIAHAVTVCKLEGFVDNEDKVCTETTFSHETTAHEVMLSDYWLDRTEVTVARYRRCVAAGVCPEPPYSSGAQRFDKPLNPVILVNWPEASAFCAWEGGRLPTEAEWERAAKGIVGRRYPWGNVYNPTLSNHGVRTDVFGDPDSGDGALELAQVGSYTDGRTPDGLLDMAGNVAEWVSDWYAKEYPGVSDVNPKGPDEGEGRVTRGGSYRDGRPWVRTTARIPELPGARRTWIGFRCARPA